MAADHLGSGTPGGIEPQLAELRQEWLSQIALALLAAGSFGAWWFVSPGPRIVLRPFCASLVLALAGGIAYLLRERAALPWYYSAQRKQQWEESGIY